MRWRFGSLGGAGGPIVDGATLAVPNDLSSTLSDISRVFVCMSVVVLFAGCFRRLAATPLTSFKTVFLYCLCLSFI
jgi:hypothetical protein